MDIDPRNSDKRLTGLLREWVREHSPPGGRLVLMCDSYPLVEICCRGSDPEMGYFCALKPGHSGDCWSKNKRVDFTPEYTPLLTEL